MTGGAMPRTRPTGWVFLDRHSNDGITIRWQRGDTEAHLLRGNKIGEWTSADLLGKIAVSPSGWTDVTDIRLAAEIWARGKRCPKCGSAA